MARAFSCARVGLVGVILTAFSLQAAAPPRIEHDKLACVPPGDNAKVAVAITSESPLAAVRVYFRAEQAEGEHYLEMRRGGNGTYWAVLPKPKKETKTVLYRIVAKTIQGGEAKTEEFSVSVASPCNPALNQEEEAYGSNLVMGLLSDQISAIPEGFKCEGIIGKISVEGVLLPHDECRQYLAAAAATSAATTTALIVGGAAAAVGAGIIISNSGGGSEAPVSRSRPPAAPPITASGSVK